MTASLGHVQKRPSERQGEREALGAPSTRPTTITAITDRGLLRWLLSFDLRSLSDTQWMQLNGRQSPHSTQSLLCFHDAVSLLWPQGCCLQICWYVQSERTMVWRLTIICSQSLSLTLSSLFRAVARIGTHRLHQWFTVNSRCRRSFSPKRYMIVATRPAAIDCIVLRKHHPCTDGTTSR